MNPEKITKMDEEVKKWSRKDPMAIKKAMVYPHTLEALERGAMVKDYNANSTNLDSEDEEDPRTPASVSSQVGFQGHSFCFTTSGDIPVPMAFIVFPKGTPVVLNEM